MIFTRKFWSATAERVVRSFAACAASLLVVGSNVLHLNWGDIFGVAGGAALATLLLCLAGGSFGSGDGPSLLGKEKLTPPVGGPADHGYTVIELLVIVVLVLVIVFMALLLVRS